MTPWMGVSSPYPVSLDREHPKERISKIAKVYYFRIKRFQSRRTIQHQQIDLLPSWKTRCLRISAYRPCTDGYRSMETLFPHRQGNTASIIAVSIHGVLLKLCFEAAISKVLPPTGTAFLGKDGKGDTTLIHFLTKEGLQILWRLTGITPLSSRWRSATKLSGIKARW